MRLAKATEKDRFLGILAQAKYELMDGVHIPGIERRRFSEEEYEYIHGICKYIERMVELYDKKGLLVKQEYDAEGVVEVVRCKDCIFHRIDNYYPSLVCSLGETYEPVQELGYCSYGRKSDE